MRAVDCGARVPSLLYAILRAACCGCRERIEPLHSISARCRAGLQIPVPSPSGSTWPHLGGPSRAFSSTDQLFAFPAPSSPLLAYRRGIQFEEVHFLSSPPIDGPPPLCPPLMLPSPSQPRTLYLTGASPVSTPRLPAATHDYPRVKAHCSCSSKQKCRPTVCLHQFDFELAELEKIWSSWS